MNIRILGPLCVFLILVTAGRYPVPFTHKAHGSEPSLTIEIPASWERDNRKTNKGAILTFKSPVKNSGAEIEIRTESADKPLPKNIVAYTLTILGAMYDSVYFVRSFPVGGSANNANQVHVWRARKGNLHREIQTMMYQFNTGRIQIICMARPNTIQVYNPIFKNTFFSVSADKSNSTDAQPETVPEAEPKDIPEVK